MTWLWEPDGFHLFFNRDERRTRLPADPPREYAIGEQRYLAPRDGDCGGTWITVNEQGVALALLNAYAPAEPSHPGQWISRGLLVTSLAASPSPEAVMRMLSSTDLTSYRAFWLASLAAGRQARLAHWQDGVLSVTPLGDHRMPLVSSSFRSEPVRSARKQSWSLPAPGPRAVPHHLAYHRSHRPARGPFSTCMHRHDAETVSFSWIHVGRRRICFGYVPHPPCDGIPERPTAELPRRSVAHDLPGSRSDPHVHDPLG